MPIQALRSTVRLTDPHTLTALDRADGPLLGLADGDEPVFLPAHLENVLVATPSGGGTTTVLRTIGAQALALGASLEILDVGGISHTWARKLPRAEVFTGLAAIHTHLLDSAQALRRRAPAAGAGEWAGRRVLLIENLYGLVQGLRHYWSLTRPESQLQEAPAVEALATVLVAGRAAGIQSIAGNPRGSVPGLGTVAVREVFPARLVAGTAALWSRIAPEIWAVPRTSLLPGRMHHVADTTMTGLQALYLTDTEARALARGPEKKKEASR
ncbi:cell division protein FtsK [Streptomyces luteireticuli]|uniref:cell division protein FtsK n=1 Tax=Streptomyces luteireticuli TaxID=173858 RepID=UPI00355618DD